MARRGPLPDPNSGATRRGLNTLSDQKAVPAPPEFDVEEALAEHGDWLGEHGKAFWRRYAPILRDAGIICQWDVMAFSLMCSCWESFLNAQAEVQKTGASYATPRGRTELHPLVKVAQKSADQCLAIGAQFGMTASSRKRHGWVVMQGEKELDALETILQARVSNNS